MTCGLQKQITQAETNEKDDAKIETSKTIVPHDQNLFREEGLICTRNKSKGDHQSMQPSCVGHEVENRMSNALSLIPSGICLSETNRFERIASENVMAAGVGMQAKG